LPSFFENHKLVFILPNLWAKSDIMEIIVHYVKIFLQCKKQVFWCVYQDQPLTAKAIVSHADIQTKLQFAFQFWFFLQAAEIT